MAVADIVPVVHSAAFLQPYIQDNIWMQMVRDDSRLVAGRGDTISYPSDETDYETLAPVDDSTNLGRGYDATLAQIKWADPHLVTAGKVDLVLNKFYNVNAIVHTTQDLRTLPGMLQNVMRKQSERLTEQANKDIRDEFDTLTAGRVAGTTHADLNIAVTSANWGNDAHLNAIVEAIKTATVAADYAKIPRAGRTVVVSPAVAALIREKLVSDRNFLVRGATDTAMLEAALGMYDGWTIVPDNSMGDGGTTANDDAEHTMYYLRRGVGVAYAGDLRRMRSFESEEWKGILSRGEYAYGVKVIEPSKVFRGTHTIS